MGIDTSSKFKSVACLMNGGTRRRACATVDTTPQALHAASAPPTHASVDRRSRSW